MKLMILVCTFIFMSSISFAGGGGVIRVGNGPFFDDEIVCTEGTIYLDNSAIEEIYSCIDVRFSFIAFENCVCEKTGNGNYVEKRAN